MQLGIFTPLPIEGVDASFTGVRLWLCDVGGVSVLLNLFFKRWMARINLEETKWLALLGNMRPLSL